MGELSREAKHPICKYLDILILTVMCGYNNLKLEAKFGCILK